MKKQIFDGIIACFCAAAAGVFAHCYALYGDRMWLAFAFICLVCVAMYLLSFLKMIRW